MRRTLWISITCLAAAAPAAAQRPQEAQAALDRCAAMSNVPAAEQKAAADEAERLHRALLKTEPQNVDARAGLAQVLVRCQLPQAGVSGIMALLAEAEGELKTALAVEPDHWGARFTLAMLLANMPAMLGRESDAVREFERLLAQQGRRADAPHLALPWLQLGQLHASAGRRTAAVEVWRRGLALFPEHGELRARLTAAGAAAEPDTAWLASTKPAAAALEMAPIYAFAPLRAEAVNYQFQETRQGTTLRRLDVYTMPGGTSEMLQALQAMPGATRAGDGAELHVRGGDPAETPVFFDGGRLAFPGRWESLQGSAMGVVDAAVVRRAYFSSGGFSARYGNALSGVVDVETEGRPAQVTRRAGINLVQGGATVRAPIGERSGGWATMSGTDTRIITHMTGEADTYTRAPQSLQGIGGLAWEPLPGVELRTTGLGVADRYARTVEMNGHAGVFASESGMQHVSVSGRAVRPDGRRGISGSVTASRRTNSMSFGVLDRSREDRAWGGRMDADIVVGAAARLRTGLEALRYEASTTGRVPTTPSVAPGSPAATLPETQETAWHTGGYVEAEQGLGALSVVAGVRVDALPGESGASVDPRVAVAWSSGEWMVRAGAGIFHQGSWRPRYRLPDAGQPAGTPTRAEHIVAGVERSGPLSLRMEAYLKRYSDYVPSGEGPMVTAGTNTGVDAMARWSPRSGLNGWVSYSLLRGRVELESGEQLPSTLDVTHSLTSVARLPIGTSWELGATARYATGKPYTPVRMDAEGSPVYSAVHGGRMPEYQRLDGRITRYFLGGSRRTALVYLEMLNLLDRRNVMSYTYSAGAGEQVPIHSVFAHRTLVLGLELQFN